MSDFVHMESAGTCEGRAKCRFWELRARGLKWKFWVKIVRYPWQLNKNYIFAVKF
jgi:hypothetical protein